MEIRELNTHHRPAARAFVEVVIQNHVLFSAILCSLPTTGGRTHRVQIGDNESASPSQCSKDFSVISVEVGQIALIQVRHRKIETMVIKKAEVLHVSETIRVSAAFELSGRADHWLAEVYAQDLLRSVV
jgi:hypothetical protein